MMNIKYFVTAVVLATSGTVLTATHIDSLDVRQTGQQMRHVDTANNVSHYRASWMADDPAEVSGDLIIACVPVEGDDGHVQWIYESSDISC